MPATRLRHSSVRRADDFEPAGEPSVCKIIVLYEDTSSRIKAQGVCERLIERFWEDVQFDVGWWKFHYLADPQIAETAGQTANDADLLIVAAAIREELPPCVRNWLEKWIVRRPPREAALVALLGHPKGAEAKSLLLYSYLRTVAQRAHLDFLASPGWELSVTEPETTTATEAAEDSPSPVLTEQPVQPKPPPHWGINE